MTPVRPQVDERLSRAQRLQGTAGVPNPARHSDLHGNVPDGCPAVLLIVDVLNALRFEDSEAFVPRAEAVAKRIAHLKARAKRAGIPVVYVNDNVGRWRSDLSAIIEDSTTEDAPGSAAARALAPTTTSCSCP